MQGVSMSLRNIKTSDNMRRKKMTSLLRRQLNLVAFSHKLSQSRYSVALHQIHGRRLMSTEAENVFASAQLPMNNPAKKADSEKTTDEKAAEVGSGLWALFKKYGPVAVPLFIGTLLSLLVINSPYCRDQVEDYLPGYMHFMRTYYGFDDEDLDEKERIKRTLRDEGEAVDVVVYFSNGETLELQKVDATQSNQAFLKSVYENRKNGSKIVDIRYKDAEGKVGGGDNAVENIGINEGGVVKAEDSPHNHNQDLNGGGAGAGAGAGAGTVKLYPWRSLWDAVVMSDDGKKNGSKSKSLQNTNKGSTTKDIRTHHQFVDYRFANTAQDLFQGFETYKKCTKLDSIPTVMRPLVSKEETTRGGSSSKKASQPQKDNQQQTDPAEVKRMISYLEERLYELEAEKKMVRSREIDDVDKDIKQVKQEISALKRKLNFFYFF